MAANPTDPAEPSVDSAATSASDEPVERWWEADGMPWGARKPGRKDITCLVLIVAIAVYGVAMMPLQPIMLGFTPHLLAALGSRTGAIMVGALAATGDLWWPVLLVVGSIMAMKFDLVFWWAGRLWGRGLIDMWSGRSPRAAKRNARAERLALRYETLAILVTYLPIPIPGGVVYAALGWAGTSLRKLLIVDLIGALASTAIYMGVGFWLGGAAVDLIEEYNKYLWYVSLGILVIMLCSVFYNEWRRGKTAPADAEEPAPEV